MKFYRTTIWFLLRSKFVWIKKLVCFAPRKTTCRSYKRASSIPQRIWKILKWLKTRDFVRNECWLEPKEINEWMLTIQLYFFFFLVNSLQWDGILLTTHAGLRPNRTWLYQCVRCVKTEENNRKLIQ